MGIGNGDDQHEQRRTRWGAPMASLVLCGLITLVYLWRPRFLDPVTIWPFWLWTGLGLVIALPGIFGRRRGLLWAVMAWLLVTCFAAEEPRFLLRSVLPPASVEKRAGRTLRLVTVNCGGGDIGAVRDALALDPDIVTVQEPPAVREMQALLAGKPEWGLAPSIGAAVLARGEVGYTELERRFSHYMTIATVTPACLETPVTLTVFSVHLNLPALRVDLWNPRAWGRALKLRGVREESVRLLMLFVDQALAEGPVIIGGDFNTPGQDSLLDPLRARLTDCFAVSGRGWPNTITADYPMSRIDGIWVSDQMRPLSSRVVYTPNSDHRMVVAEAQL
ncbi:MAG: endonuclease/exonuclease/phosphatase family protein [Armatimonadetes bacterium]|nr:endonuclease/exonuclease/phosphatase family protein [Armatimonadota bacterium]